jgi:uncharacterized protein (TIGR03435 family)
MTAWTDVIGWTLLHFVWEGTLVACVIALVLAALRNASARVRYVVACAGLLTALVAVAVTPAVLLGVEGQLSPVAPRVAAIPRQLLAGIERTTGGAATLPSWPAGTRSSGRGTDVPLTTFVVLWATGVVLLTLRLALGWWRVRQLHQAALTRLASPWLATATRIAEKLQLSRVIHVVDSYEVATPAVIGWLRPVVLLPIAALANLSPDQVQAILAHELAHVRRHDFIVNLLQTVAETILFYHPAVWWLSSRIRTEREHCCDDVAVDVCGDPVAYAEALTTIAAWARDYGDVAAPTSAGGSLAVAATGGSLLHRVRRLLRLPIDSERRRPKAPFVIAAAVLLIVLVGSRLLLVAQAPTPPGDSQVDHRLGPAEVNRILGFKLFPGPVHYVGDDPRDARAWDVKVAFPGGEMSFLGFTGRSLIRYAFDLDDVQVVDGPSWLDAESNALRAETSALVPTDLDNRQAIRVALEGRYGISIGRESRLFPVYGLMPVNRQALGPNIRPAAVDCIEDLRQRPDVMGPSLHARGQVDIPFCGMDNTFHGPRGYRVTLAEFAHSLRGFNMGLVDSADTAREVVDQTGLTGVYDLELNLGFVPLAAIATAHPAVGIGFGPMIRTFPQAIEEQLGLKLVPSEVSREVVVITAARQVLQ